MKKGLVLVLASSLILGGAFSLASCGEAPAEQQGGGQQGGQQGGEQGGGQQGGEQGGGSQTDPVKEYTVTFNYNYTGAPAAQTVKVKEGAKVAKPANPAREGYTFDNWYENAAGTGSAFNFDSTISANKTLYAKWTQNGGGGGEVTPDPTPTPAGGILTNSKVPDEHQGTLAKDASWNRYTLPIRATTSADAGYASYFACSHASANVPTDGGADSDGFYGLGGFRSAYGATLTWTVYASAAAEMGLYFEMSQHTAESLFDTLYGAKVNDKAVDTSTLKLVNNPDGANSSASDKYIFAGFVNLTAGPNTIVITRNETAPSGGAYNWWGIRLSAQTATISDKAAS